MLPEEAMRLIDEGDGCERKRSLKHPGTVSTLYILHYRMDLDYSPRTLTGQQWREAMAKKQHERN